MAKVAHLVVAVEAEILILRLHKVQELEYNQLEQVQAVFLDMGIREVKVVVVAQVALVAQQVAPVEQVALLALV
jgi:hypothetical protein